MGKRKKKLSEFGEFLVAEIYKAGMSKVDFCTAVGINKPYFYESLAGTPPSQEILEKMFEVLDANLPAADKIQPNDLFDISILHITLNQAKSCIRIPLNIQHG